MLPPDHYQMRGTPAVASTDTPAIVPQREHRTSHGGAAVID
ncbi:hypothetical protein HSR121_2667 [Halapricum desulfuricans]|uniref:Uncharacterized protein n=1 Tax=Halapricum desulfuricans TaxID=2841257 RepID=A0A897N2R6_9EURY|nr:hypothetical protein HSR121_2667 [Halapricum desulfuricans]